MDTDVKTIDVTILGFSLFFSERVTQDVLDVNEFATQHMTDDGGFDSDASFAIYSAKVIHDALKDALKKKMPWQAKKFKPESLIQTLRPNQLTAFVAMVLELEGAKKKVQPEAVKKSDASSRSTSSKGNLKSKTRKPSGSQATGRTSKTD